MPNQLQHSTSPYLLQHAHNPVDWHEWNDATLAQARAGDKPIFLSIGYAACHWCHVMAHESFEDESTAAIMNAHFINIKVDREQRPDLDSIYMSATVAMTGSGGWPMSVFLTPDLQPFYCGTYFPPVARYNMPSFKDLLLGIANAWKEQRGEVDRVSAEVTSHLQRANGWSENVSMLTEALLDSAAQHLSDSYDWGFGGWGQAPKFPQPMTIEFLLRRVLSSPRERGAGGEGELPTKAALTPNPSPYSGRGELEAALHALQAMARGGMYDVVGGGFSRYSTDNLWRVPHFEKMLYDNAQLVLVYLHAWQITGDPFYKRIVTETLDFVLRELTHAQGGFFSSLDADSEHEEGKFYVWSHAEIKDLLDADFDFFKTAYGITVKGNWEDKTVLQRALDDATLAARFGLTREQVADKLIECHARLLTARSQRIRPGTDDKVLTAWNGLMLSAFAQAAREFPQYYDAATKNADFLLTALRPNNQLRRAWREGKTSDEVFLEDYAALILGLLDLYETDFNNRWFASALELADEMMTRFDDPDGGFFDAPTNAVRADGHPPLLLRPKDMQDNATPSGNALACHALLHLAALTDRADFRTKAEASLGRAAEHALRYPTAFARWLQAADFAVGNVQQVAVVGDPGRAETRALLAELRAGYYPRRVQAASALPLPENAPVLLHDRPLINDHATAYVCEGFVCQLPVTTPVALKEQFNKG